MPEDPRALLLLGSPKPTGSTSEVLGRGLIDRLAERGWSAEVKTARRVYRDPEKISELMEAIEDSQLFIVSFPLYVDSLPAPLIRVFEEVAQHRADQAKAQKQRMVAIVNCGFPEERHNHLALEICRRFARETGFAWAGGLSLGGGGAIDGHPLGEVRWMARHVIAALDLTADALAVGEPIPDAAIQRMAKPMLWSRLYTWFGDFGWRRQAKEHGMADHLYDRPFE